MTDMMGNLDALTEHVIDRAQQAAEAMIARAQKEASQSIAQGEGQAQELEDELVETGTLEVQSIHRQIVSQARLRLRGHLLEVRKEILDRIVSETETRLQRICAEDGEAQIRSIVELVRKELVEEEADEVIVYLSAEDAKRFQGELSEALVAEPGLRKVEIRESEISGGAVVEIPIRHLQIDASFDEALREAVHTIERVVQEEIFSDKHWSENRNESQSRVRK